MKYNTERDEEIFRLWNEEHLTFREISQRPLPTKLSLRRVRNIIYTANRAKFRNADKIYSIFRLHFLQSQNVQASIWFAYENQPSVCVSERTIRYAVSQQLQIKRSNKSSQLIQNRN